MPFLPKVPHIVGDDDDLNDAENQSQGTNGSDNDESDTSSSYDDDSDDEGSNESTQEEEEEEDWSNNISYILRTPEHVPEEVQQSPLEATDPEELSSPAFEVEIEQTQDDQVEHKEQEVIVCAPDEVTMEMDDQPNLNMEELSKKHSPEQTQAPDSPMAANEALTPMTPTGHPEHYSPGRTPPISTPPQDDVVTSERVPISQEKEEIEIFEVPRRFSLRSAYRTNPNAFSAPAKQKPPRNRQRQRQRQRPQKEKVNEEPTTPPITIGARVAKRPRRLVVTTGNSPAEKSPEKLAKPVEVTEYFTKVSATLVSHRVNLSPFLYMRQRIDRLVGEAIAKTKSK